MPHRRSIIKAAAAAAVLMAFPKTALSGPPSRLWPRWQAHDPNATTRLDHGAWTQMLERRLTPGNDGVNYIDYAGWLGSADRDRLTAYLSDLQSTNVDRLNRAEQFAYWANFYNAGTIQVILNHYPVSSIRDIDISPGFLANGPWGAKLFTVLGEQLSLDDIEHRIMRPIWRDPRIHYAVNCAAIGCPNLVPQAFTANGLEKMLEANARTYVNDPRGAAAVNGNLAVSSIYRWFQEDFGGNEQGVLAHLRRYAGKRTQALLQDRRSIDRYRYDWALNDTRTAG